MKVGGNWSITKFDLVNNIFFQNAVSTINFETL
jgi:hypothetical protein